MPIAIDSRVCTACGTCAEICPTDVLRLGEDRKPVIVYPEDCQDCFLCVFDCPSKAITLTIQRLPEEPSWHAHWTESSAGS